MKKVPAHDPTIDFYRRCCPLCFHEGNAVRRVNLNCARPVTAVACVPVSGQSLIVLSRDLVYLLEYAMRSSQTEMGKAEE
jgi:hypothetical protein